MIFLRLLIYLRSMVEGHVGTVRGVRGLLQEGGRASEGEDVDGDGEALGGEDGVHEGDILHGRCGGDGEDEYTGR